MKKIIKLNIENTTKERKTADSYSELYSYDKNNGSFEFEILNDTLTTEQVTALFKFTDSNKIWKTTGTVEGNKVKVTFDTSLITQNETVICYLYFAEEQRTSDTFRFKFKVKVSEIDKMNRYEVKERFINNTVIVDRLDVVTKTELQEALKNVGGVATVDTSTFLTKEEFETEKGALATFEELQSLEQTYLPRGMVEVTDGLPISLYAKEKLDAEGANNGEYLGRLFNNGKTTTLVLKEKNGDEFEFVRFEGAMITVANVLPKDYDYQAFNDPEKRITLLTDRNFKEMVATPEFKAVVKESLREIVKEIIKEEN